MRELRPKLFCALFILVLVDCVPCAAQVATGTPPFGTFTSGPDVLNLANLNVHLSVPIVNKPGRGMAFTYDLSYDSSVWSPVTSGSTKVWQPVSNFGWQGMTEALTGYASYFTQAFTCTYRDGQLPYTGYTFTAYRDQFGVSHPFLLTVVGGSGVNRCPGLTGPTTATGTTNDGSGYSMTVTSEGLSASVSSRGGDSLVVPLNAGPGAGLITDRNGNEISVNGTGVFTDTLGQTALTIAGVGTPASPVTLTFAAPSGAAAADTVKYVSQNVQTNFGCPGITEYSATGVSLVSEIDRPDGAKYTFTYEETTAGISSPVTGRIASVTLPTGGTISYAYSGGSNGITCADGSTATLTRTTPDGSWNYAHAESGTAWTTTIKDPQANQTSLNFQGIYETERQVYQGATSLLKTIFTCYNGNITTSLCNSTAITLPITQRTTFVVWPGSSLESRSDDLYNGLGLMTEKEEYAYGSGSAGSLVRQSVIAYASVGNGIFDRPGSITITSGAGATVAKTFYTYDSNPLTSVMGVAQHNDASFGTSDLYRGNLAMVQDWVSGSTYLTSSATYDTTGQRLTTTDPAGNVVMFGYTDNYFTDNGANPPQAFTSAAPTNAFVTKITDPILGAAGTYGYYVQTGEPALSADQNGGNSYAHYDSVDRLSSEYAAEMPSGGRGWMLFQYPSQTEIDAYTSITSTAAASTCTSCRHDQTIFDNQGRQVSEVLASDPDGATTISTSYDSLGRMLSRTNPYRSTSDPTYGVETETYDGTSRITGVTHADGSVSETFYGTAVGTAGGAATQLCSSGTYGLGYPVLSLDPSTKKRQRWVDALGRTLEVDEPDSTGALTVATCYLYDGGNNATQIVQGTETRTYSYDGLSRLVASSSPESGSVNYSFTSATGGLCGGSSLLICSKTDARGTKITNSYDALNRIISSVYSDGTPEVQYFYDQSTFDGLTITNGKGRLTGMSDGSGESAFSYDLLGDVLTEVHTISGISKTSSYVYNLDESLASLTYPSGRRLAYSYSNAQRTLSVTDSTSGVSYVSAGVYSPSGSLSNMVFGKTGTFGGVTETFTHNSRFQLTSQLASSANGTVLSLNYGFPNSPGNNGRATSFTNNLDNGRSVSATYDPLNRLSSAQSQATAGADCWGESFGYDRWGNLSSVGVLKCTGTALNISVTNNRITSAGFTYNASGDMTDDSITGYTYDAEQRLTSADGVIYTYDGRDLRVEKSNGTIYWRGFMGDAVSESDLSGNITSDYVFFDALRAARVDSSGNVYFYFADKLGSTRAITTSSGALCYSADFTPFGGEIAFANACPQNYKFTGYERDSETGLDYAFYRHYSARLGRFLQPDALGGSLTAPQSLNRYAYALNDPCTMTDPLGLTPCTLNIAINYNANLSVAQKTALQNQINALFGPSVSANFSFSGAAQYTLNVNNAGPNDPPGDLGDSGYAPGSNFLWANRISRTFSGIGGGRIGTIMGTVGAHELVHAITNIGDPPFNTQNPNDLMTTDSNPNKGMVRTQLARNLLRLTDKEKGELLAACQRHPNSSGAPSAQSEISADGFGLNAFNIASQPDNSSVTTSQQDSLPAACTNGTLDGCTVTGPDNQNGNDGADSGIDSDFGEGGSDDGDDGLDRSDDA
jgi:RHS repeat-associated protein